MMHRDSLREQHESQGVFEVFEFSGVFLDYNSKAELAERFDIEHFCAMMPLKQS